MKNFLRVPYIWKREYDLSFFSNNDTVRRITVYAKNSGKSYEISEGHLVQASKEFSPISDGRRDIIEIDIDYSEIKVINKLKDKYKSHSVIKKKDDDWFCTGHLIIVLDDVEEIEEYDYTPDWSKFTSFTRVKLRWIMWKLSLYEFEKTDKEWYSIVIDIKWETRVDNIAKAKMELKDMEAEHDRLWENIKKKREEIILLQAKELWSDID